MVADGMAGNRSGVVLNTSVASSAPVDAHISAILKFLNYAHDVVHNVFIEMTVPIYHVMGPQGEENR